MYQIMCGLWIDLPNEQNYAWKWTTKQSKPHHTTLHQTEMNSMQQIHQLLISIGGCFVSKVICVNLQKRWNERAHVDKKKTVWHWAPSTEHSVGMFGKCKHFVKIRIPYFENWVPKQTHANIGDHEYER